MRPVLSFVMTLAVLVSLLVCGVADAGCRGGACGPVRSVASATTTTSRKILRGGVTVAERSADRTVEATRATLRGSRAVIRWTVRR